MRVPVRPRQVTPMCLHDHSFIRGCSAVVAIGGRDSNHRADCSSATFIFGGTKLSSTHPKPASCSASSNNPTPSPRGRRSLSPKRGASHLEGPSFDELVLSFADAGELYVRYYLQ